MSPSMRRRRPRAAADAAGEPADGPATTAGSRGTLVETAAAAADPAPAVTDDHAPAAAGRPVAERRRALAHSTPVLLLRAAHPRLAVLVAAGLAVAAAISGRSGREVVLVLLTALVGQAVLGWHNDLVDRTRDARRAGGAPSGKPLADGHLEPGTAWFALICAVLLLVPLSVQNGVTAGALYLASVAVGLVGNVVLRRSVLSFLPWAVAWALYPGFLSYGGWGGRTDGAPPEPAMVVLAALLGVGVHVLTSLPGLVADHEHGVRHLPLRLALRTGATRLLVAAAGWTLLVLAGLLAVGSSAGLSR